MEKREERKQLSLFRGAYVHLSVLLKYFQSIVFEEQFELPPRVAMYIQHNLAAVSTGLSEYFLTSSVLIASLFCLGLANGPDSPLFVQGRHLPGSKSLLIFPVLTLYNSTRRCDFIGLYLGDFAVVKFPLQFQRF